VHGVWYGSEKDTNNEAECQALVNLLETLASGSWTQGVSEILIVGDS
jgi:ribonuclease HI